MTRWVLPKIDGVAACRDADPDLFFPEDRSRVEEARALCAGCPLLASCRDWAIVHERDGIWGATTAGERRALRRRLHITVQGPRIDFRSSFTSPPNLAHDPSIQPTRVA